MKRIIYALLPVLICCGVASSQIQIDWQKFARHTATATAYTVGDVVGDSTYLEFKGAGRAGVINSAYLAFDTSNTANGTFRLLFFKDTLCPRGLKVPRLDDHAAFTLLAGLDSLIIGYLDFTLATGGFGAGTTMSHAWITNQNLGFQTNKGSIFGILIATGAYQPKKSGNVTVKLWYLK